MNFTELDPAGARIWTLIENARSVAELRDIPAFLEKACGFGIVEVGALP